MFWNISEKQKDWVEKTLSKLSIEEKNKFTKISF
jgi:hypothetical protein